MDNVSNRMPVQFRHKDMMDVRRAFHFFPLQPGNLSMSLTETRGTIREEHRHHHTQDKSWAAMNNIPHSRHSDFLSAMV
jgi:hypothetical protein